jgi:hypothetical protein
MSFEQWRRDAESILASWRHVDPTKVYEGFGVARTRSWQPLRLSQVPSSQQVGKSLPSIQTREPFGEC